MTAALGPDGTDSWWNMAALVLGRGPGGNRGRTQDRLSLPLASILKTQEATLALGYRRGVLSGPGDLGVRSPRGAGPRGASGLSVMRWLAQRISTLPGSLSLDVSIDPAPQQGHHVLGLLAEERPEAQFRPWAPLGEAGWEEAEGQWGVQARAGVPSLLGG